MSATQLTFGSLFALGLLCSCTSANNQAQAGPPVPSATQQLVATPASSMRVNGDRAMEHVKKVVGLGPRPAGSEGHQKLQSYLRSQLQGIAVEEDAFTASTPAGRFPLRNFIAKFPGTTDGTIVIGGHYDTNYPLKDYVGANDGGSSTGLLLELAHVLRAEKLQGHSVWLVWFDGEESFRDWSPSDSLYGSRHLAQKWERDGTLKKIKALLLVDMIGDAKLNIFRDQNSTPWLLDVVAQAAARLGHREYFFNHQTQVEDDHIPFVRRGVPVADLIDFEYGPANAYHHTSQDTLDKLSPRSLEIVGNTILETVRLLGP